jgi:hypothetical protein
VKLWPDPAYPSHSLAYSTVSLKETMSKIMWCFWWSECYSSNFLYSLMFCFWMFHYPHHLLTLQWEKFVSGVWFRDCTSDLFLKSQICFIDSF